MTENKNYQRDYWEQHKDTINAKRRERYHLNDDCKVASKKRARDSYTSRRAERIAFMVAGRTLGEHSREVVLEDGAVFKLYSTSAMSNYVGVTSTTVRAWIRDKRIPESTVIVGKRMWFSKAYMDMVRKIIVLLGTTRLAEKSMQVLLKSVMDEEYSCIKILEIAVRRLSGVDDSETRNA